ncbi:hypothetical protein [Nostoc commune]|uniref:hypothetical protein n=1 Tax=Nostoc commune TaxID=1178 RepID=UPI0018C84F08|nr:hypothetical protein [Nostoc commune]MBG1262323.1 hypothetical protein [Nostoc commune BAE]
MQSQNSNLKTISDQSVTKWIVAASLVTFLLITTFIFIGLKSQYIEVNFCIATVNCSQAPEQVTDKAQTFHITEDSLEEASKPIKITVKPLEAAIVAGVTSTAAMAALMALGIVGLPIELVLAIGALIGTGTYFALKTLY